MNQLGIALVWSAAQVTLVTLIAVGLYLIVSRRGPSAGSWVATLYLGVTIVLMLPAFCPLPDWWEADEGRRRCKRAKTRDGRHVSRRA